MFQRDIFVPLFGYCAVERYFQELELLQEFPIRMCKSPGPALWGLCSKTEISQSDPCGRDQSWDNDDGQDHTLTKTAEFHIPLALYLNLNSCQESEDGQ